MAGEDKDEEKGCISTTWGYIKSFFLGVALVIEFIIV